jgi:hypothetical protein
LSLKTRALFAFMVLVVLGIYSYPTFRTTQTIDSRILPPIFGPDLSLYLNISTTHTNQAGQVIDPYYGVDVPVARMGYLKFGVAFRFFKELNSLLSGNLWWAVLLWNLFWWGILCIIALWFFRRFLPDNSPPAVLVGLAFLMLFNFGVLQNQVVAWTHFPGFRAFQNVQLPYIRSFFPQIPVPLVIFYLGLQIRALQKWTWSLWAAMAVTQFLAFTIFPYAMLVMAGISSVAILGQLVSRKQLKWIVLSGYAAACAVGDLLFFLHGNQIARTGGPVQQPLIHLQLSVLPQRIGGMWILLAVLAAAVFLICDLASEVKWPVFGLAATNLLLLLGDVFFSETALQVSAHVGYFVQATAAVLVAFLLTNALARLPSPSTIARSVLYGISGLLILNGLLIAEATYRYFLAANQEQAELSRELTSDSLQENDLVIARSLTVDDDCAWVSLISKSHVLFCRSAQVLLSPEQNQQIQRFRQALYLYFTNKDDLWVERVLNDRASSELSRLTFLGQITTNVEDRKKNIDAVRSELIPVLVKVENRDPEVVDFFRHYRRIVVFDDSQNPYFAGSRLSQYFQIVKQQRRGDLLILDCAPLRADSSAGAR